ncbi:YfhO family protein [Limosilactobacillus mucosae]|uniref:YfhO family protein n=1 Tax=Limosilactobacillus mucosae TaxID=97478 RepID=UPI0015D56522|nr:YfhO family protein [Limosilactobacillus mucosae]QLI94269.1 YfhO family protein [Limosilactobacillus mucosae]
MNFSFEKRDHRMLYLKYTIMFALIALFMFGSYAITGHTLIWNKDALNQHVPLLGEYRKVVLGWLHHPTRPLNWWSWNMGLGTDTFQVFSYYTIGDVFAYLALLFPAVKLTLAYQVITVVRTYFVGLTFCWFAGHFSFRDHVILGGAIVYMVNSYLLYASIAQPFFMTTFILFPILVVQLERVLQNGSAWPLTLAFLWMLVNNYYLAYVLGIGTFIYLVLRVATHYRTTLSYGKTLAKLAFASITSILVAACLLVPEIMAVMNSTRAGSEFANGLKHYPLYYYLFLPKQLINGDQWTFMFWSALGLVSIAFIAIVYLYTRTREFPLLSISLALALVMLLIPAVGAFFNGMMAASNRWTLLIYLPIAMTVCLLLQNATRLDRHTLWILTSATGIYLVVLVATYIFQNDTTMFMPIIFLIMSLLMLWIINLHGTPHPDRWLVTIILANAACNALYVGTPYNGNFANSTLVRGQYQSIAENRYGGLEKGLNDGSFFRVSTISNNQITSGGLLDNDLTSGMHNIDSYYSLQNKYLGQFSTSLQNTQYQANVPLRQVDDRTVLNNFFGVKYLFVQSNSENANKIPGGYFLDATTEPKINYDVGQPTNPTDQTQLVPTATNRYRTSNAFPLLYWQDSYISQKTYQKLSPTAKERALASGVTVSSKNSGATNGMKTANLKGNVIKLKSQLVSNRLNKIKSTGLKYTDSLETYQLQLPQLTSKAFKKQLKDSELHVEFASIKYQPFSMKQQIAYEQKHEEQQATNPGDIVNHRFNQYKFWRYHILNGSPDMSFAIKISGRLGSETIEQPKQSKLSFFKLVKNGTMNIGYFAKGMPTSLTLKPSKLGTYQWQYQVVAEKLGTKYNQEVRQIQKHALKNVKFKRNQLSGTITTSRVGILTSSIPYSTGWTATVDGKKATLLRTNQAFVGLRLPAGTHRVVLHYHVPGLALGCKISLFGLIWMLLAAVASWLIKRHDANKASA